MIYDLGISVFCETEATRLSRDRSISAHQKISKALFTKQQWNLYKEQLISR